MKKTISAILWIVMGSILATGCADKPAKQLSAEETKIKAATVEPKRPAPGEKGTRKGG